MFDRLADLVSHRPRAVLGFWLALLLLALPLASRVGGVMTSDTGAAPGSQAELVRAALEQHFARAGGRSLVLIGEATGPQAAGADAAALDERFLALLDELSGSGAVASVQTSATAALFPSFASGKGASVALLELETEDEAEAYRVMRQLSAQLPRSGPIHYTLTGDVAIEHELREISERDALRAELIGVSISLVVLILVFGAVVAAALPLAVALVSVTLSMAALYLLGQAWPIASFAQSMVTLLGLATGIDYALLMVSRYREELAKGQDGAGAAARATRAAGKAVGVSGLTVLLALSALLIPPLGFIRSIGAASIIVMFFSLAVSLSALPALLALLGPRVNALRVSRREPGTRGKPFWQRRAAAVMRRPLLWTVFGVLALVLMALPATQMQLAVGGVRGLTEETRARQAYGVLERLDLAQLEYALDVLVDFGERGFYHPSSVRAVAELTRAAQSLPGANQVLSPSTAPGLPALLVYQYYASPELAQASPLKPLADATISSAGRYALLKVYPGSSDPAQIGALLGELRERAHDLGLKVTIGGRHVANEEWTQTLYRSFPYAVLFVYAATFILLGLAFRSLLIPLKAILLNTLTVLASFGVLTLVFQHGVLARLVGVSGGLGFVETSVPIFIFAVVFGLSMDYEVFLVSRIVEGHQRGLSDREAVMHALAATGSVISSAALIMVIVFAVFILSHIVLIKSLSLGLSVAVLLDATLVRLALVPAVMLLTSRWNWWFPKPVARLARRVDFGHD